MLVIKRNLASIYKAIEHILIAKDLYSYSQYSMTDLCAASALDRLLVYRTWANPIAN